MTALHLISADVVVIFVLQLCTAKLPHELRHVIRSRRIILFAICFVLLALQSIKSTATSRLQQTSIQKQTVSPSFHHRIPINNETYLAADVSQIVHIPNEAKIIVQFHRNRTCLQPQLIGRLSGLFLSKIQWDYQAAFVNKEEELFLVGHYNAPSPGKYYIEIIVTMCQRLGMDTDATNVCLVDPVSHRLTSKGAAIEADFHERAHNEPFNIGFWYNSLDNSSRVQPLYTRFQPQDCRGKNATFEHCKNYTDTARFEPYAFQFIKPFSLLEHLKDKTGRICFVGASHSRVMTRFAGRIGAASHIQIIHSDIRFAANFTASKVDDMLKCDKVVIGVGQWDAGHHGGGPTPFWEFERSLNQTMNEVVKPLIDSNVSVYFRNMHYNPLGDLITHCPPIDWRNPNVIDLYNQILNRLCQVNNVPLIDTNEITNIMWERHEDWAHYKDISGELEARYVVYRVFSE